MRPGKFFKNISNLVNVRNPQTFLQAILYDPHIVCLDLLHRKLSRTLKITRSPGHCMMYLTCLKPENSSERN